MTSSSKNDDSPAPRKRGAPGRADNYPGMVDYGNDTRALSPQEKGELLKRYLDDGRHLVIDVPETYYPPAGIHEPRRWERIDFSGAVLQGAKLAREIRRERIDSPYLYPDYEEIIDIRGPN